VTLEVAVVGDVLVVVVGDVIASADAVAHVTSSNAAAASLVKKVSEQEDVNFSTTTANF